MESFDDKLLAAIDKVAEKEPVRPRYKLTVEDFFSLKKGGLCAKPQRSEMADDVFINQYNLNIARLILCCQHHACLTGGEAAMLDDITLVILRSGEESDRIKTMSDKEVREFGVAYFSYVFSLSGMGVVESPIGLRLTSSDPDITKKVASADFKHRESIFEHCPVPYAEGDDFTEFASMFVETV
jgi:hypothetical protein